MGSMTTVAINLKDEHQNFIADMVKSGTFISKGEVLATALDLLKTHEQVRKASLADLRTKVLVGIEQADRGEFVEFSASDIIAERRARQVSQQVAQ